MENSLTNQNINPNPDIQNQSSKKDSSKKRLFGFSHFRYLSIIEKIIIILCTLISLFLTINYLRIIIERLISGKTNFAISDLLILVIIIIPFWLANKITLKGLKRIPNEEKTDLEYQQINYTEKLSPHLSSLIKKLIITAIILFAISIISLLLFYFLFLNKAPHPINQYFPPANPCNPPRNPEVLYIEPYPYNPADPNTRITVAFNENMDPGTLSQDTVNICTKIYEPLKSKEATCRSILIQGLQPEYHYLKDDMKLEISLPADQYWAMPVSIYFTQVEVTITNKVKSICGLLLQKPYTSQIDIKRGEYAYQSNVPTLTDKTQLEIKNIKIVEKDGYYYGTGVIKNNSQLVARNVVIKTELYNGSSMFAGGKRILSNDGREGVLYIGEEVLFEIQIGPVQSYTKYVIEPQIGMD